MKAVTLSELEMAVQLTQYKCQCACLCVCMCLSTCEAVRSRHPLVNVVTLGSIGVGVVEHGARQRGAVVLGHSGHSGPDWRRRVTRLLGQWGVDPVHHRQRRAHAAWCWTHRGLIGWGCAAGAARSRVCGAHASQCSRGVFLCGVGRAAATPTSATAALGRGQGCGKDAGEGFGFDYDGGAVGTANWGTQGAAGGGHTASVGWRVRARRHWADPPHSTARHCCCHCWNLRVREKTIWLHAFVTSGAIKSCLTPCYKSTSAMIIKC